MRFKIVSMCLSICVFICKFIVATYTCLQRGPQEYKKGKQIGLPQ